MSIEVGNYKGFAFIVNKSNGGVFYEWNENRYLRFYELCAAINKSLEVKNEH